MRSRRSLVALAILFLIGSAVFAAPALVLAQSAGAASSVTKSGTGSPRTGDYDTGSADQSGLEFPDESDDDGGSGAFSGLITGRSLSTGHVSHGVSVQSGRKAKSSPTLKTSF
jgi:hypothetical protein